MGKDAAEFYPEFAITDDEVKKQVGNFTQWVETHVIIEKLDHETILVQPSILDEKTLCELSDTKTEVVETTPPVITKSSSRNDVVEVMSGYAAVDHEVIIVKQDHETISVEPSITVEKTLSELFDTEIEAAETTPLVITESSSRNDGVEVLTDYVAVDHEVIIEKQDHETISVEPSITEEKTLSDTEIEAAEATPLVITESSSRNDVVEVMAEYAAVDHEFYRTTRGRRRLTNRKHYWGNRKASRGTNLLPLSAKDLANTPHEQTDLTFKAFLRDVRENVLSLSKKEYQSLLGMFFLCLGIPHTIDHGIAHGSGLGTTSFDFEVGKTTNTLGSLLSFREAFFAILQQTTVNTMLITCYTVTTILVLQVNSGIQILLVALLLFIPLFRLTQQLEASPSRVYVACGGSFKLPLIWFKALAALGFSLIFMSVVLLVVYLIWRYKHKGKSGRAG